MMRLEVAVTVLRPRISETGIFEDPSVPVAVEAGEAEGSVARVFRLFAIALSFADG